MKTGNYTASASDQLVCNHASTAFTITLPAGSANDTVIIANAGAALVTVGRNGSQKINSVAADGTVPKEIQSSWFMWTIQLAGLRFNGEIVWQF